MRMHSVWNFQNYLLYGIVIWVSEVKKFDSEHFFSHTHSFLGANSSKYSVIVKVWIDLLFWM